MKYVLAVDYDGTLFEGNFPELGNPRKEVFKKVKEFKEAGSSIILWTCREGKSLQEAVSRCAKEGLEFDAVNENCQSQDFYQEYMMKEHGHQCALRKIFAHMYVDDKSPGSIKYFLECDITEEMEKAE